MSDHLTEDLVEGSIRLLHATTPAGDRGVRDRIAALYRFQADYDCSFTHFRLMDILLERGYTHRFDLRAHPEYPSRAEYFDQLKEFTALAETPDDDEPDDSAWLEQGYIDPPHLYCDAGTALWHTMIDAGHLTGPDAEPLRPIPMRTLVHEIALAAEQTGDIELIALWHALGFRPLLDDLWADDPRDVPAIKAIRDIAHRTGAASYDLPDGYRPPLAFYDKDPLESWWYDWQTYPA